MNNKKSSTLNVNFPFPTCINIYLNIFPPEIMDILNGDLLLLLSIITAIHCQTQDIHVHEFDIKSACA